MSQLNITSIKNKRGDFGPTLIGLSTVTGNLNVTGTISGDGSGLTGIADTANIKSDTITVTGVVTATTFDGNISGGVTGDFSIEDKIVHTGDTNTAIRFPTDDTVTVETSGSEAIRVDSSGRLLIGTSTSPSGGDSHSQNAPLLVQGRIGADTDSGRINLQRGQALPAVDASIGTISFTDSSNNAYARIEVEADATTGSNDYPGRIKFSTTADGGSSPTERLRITSAGNVSIQNDSGKFTAGTSDDLQIYHDGSHSYILDNGTGAIKIKGDDIRIENAAGRNIFKASSTATELYFDNGSSSSKKLETTTSGVTVTGDVNSTSDINLKKDIEVVTSATEMLNELRGVRFIWKENGEPSLGVIAQEVEAILPELIKGEEGDKSVNYSGLIGVLIESVKELSARVEELENR